MYFFWYQNILQLLHKLNFCYKSDLLFTKTTILMGRSLSFSLDLCLDLSLWISLDNNCTKIEEWLTLYHLVAFVDFVLILSALSVWKQWSVQEGHFCWMIPIVHDTFFWLPSRDRTSIFNSGCLLARRYFTDQNDPKGDHMKMNFG